MRLLTLIRHAKASWDNPELGDYVRPLSLRGQRDAPEMARMLATELEPPLQLVSSPALRALTTAQIFATTLKLNHADIKIEQRIYDATLGTLLDIVNTQDDRNRHVVLFGHNPGFTELAQLFAEVPFGEMPTCGVLTLSFDAAHWREVAPRSGSVVRYRFPKDAEAG
jgi:phosphohistidine phosphatase